MTHRLDSATWKLSQEVSAAPARPRGDKCTGVPVNALSLWATKLSHKPEKTDSECRRLALIQAYGHCNARLTALVLRMHSSQMSRSHLLQVRAGRPRAIDLSQKSQRWSPSPETDFKSHGPRQLTELVIMMKSPFCKAARACKPARVAPASHVPTDVLLSDSGRI